MKPRYIFSCGCPPTADPDRLNGRNRRPICKKHPDARLVNKIWPCRCLCGREVIAAPKAYNPYHPDCKLRLWPNQVRYNEKLKAEKEAAKTEPEEEDEPEVIDSLASFLNSLPAIPKPTLKDFPGLLDLAERGLIG